MVNIISILNKPNFDNSINKIEYHVYQPFTSTTFNHMDEIRLCVQQLDLYTLTCESFLYVEGIVEFEGTATTISLTNNFPSFLFDEIRYELNGVDIDQCKNVGITTTLKNYISLGIDEENYMTICGWNSKNNIVFDKDQKFNFILPLKKILGFCEDYKHIIINSKQELILIRSRNDLNCCITATDLQLKISINKIQWWVPHVTVNELNKLNLLQILNNNRMITCSYRTWDLFEYPLLPQTNKHIWSVKSSSQLEKPRYIILGFQTNRKNNYALSATIFEHIDISNIRVYLNSEVYPYENLNLNYSNKKYTSLLYFMFCQFRTLYYGKNNEKPIFNFDDFVSKAPIFIIDCSRQNEAIKSGSVDIRIDFETNANIPANTNAYCLILHDKIIEYNPLTNIVHKII